MKKTLLNISAILILSAVISLPLISPYFHKGYFPTHDGEWAVVRLADMFRELKDFQFPPRYSGNLNFGYGYPLFNFAYPFPYYLGIILHFLKFGFVDSIKLLFAVSVPLSAIFMYLASRELWNSKLSGIISSILYVYLPYRMVDLYVRGSIGESISLIFFPLILFFVLKISKNNNVLIWGSAALFYGMLVLTHNIMAVFYSLIMLSFIVFFLFFEKKTRIKHYILFIVFGLLISAFFWIPALFEKQNILLSKIPIADRNLYFVTFKQLLLPSWGYEVPTQRSGFSYQLGWPHVSLYILTIVFLVYNFFKNKWKDNSLYLKRALLILLLAVFLSFMLFSQSAFLWELPFLREINYPWTLLAPIGFLLSLLGGFFSTKTMLRYAVFMIAILAIIFVLPYAHSSTYFDKGDNYYITNDATTTSSQELMPLWVKKFPTQRFKEKVEIINGNAGISNLLYNSKMLSLEMNSAMDTKIRVNIIYYPGWKVFINGSEAVIDYSNERGLMDVFVPKGKNNIVLTFTETPLRLISDMVSILSLLSLFIILIIGFYYRYIGISSVVKRK